MLLLEAALIFLAVIGGLHLLYLYREIPLIGHYISTWAALLMIYPPLAHARWRKTPIPIVEKSWRELARSLRLFLITSLIVFPPFLIANHYFQERTAGLTFHPVHFDLAPVLLTQLLLVSLPEEILFRGWLQGILGRFLSPLKTLILTATLFAAAHSAITLRWWHFSIFFPALLFGWLRQKTGHITAPILFHTACNLIALWISHSYSLPFH